MLPLLFTGKNQIYYIDTEYYAQNEGLKDEILA